MKNIFWALLLLAYASAIDIWANPALFFAKSAQVVVETCIVENETVDILLINSKNIVIQGMATTTDGNRFKTKLPRTMNLNKHNYETACPVGQVIHAWIDERYPSDSFYSWTSMAPRSAILICLPFSILLVLAFGWHNRATLFEKNE